VIAGSFPFQCIPSTLEQLWLGGWFTILPRNLPPSLLRLFLCGTKINDSVDTLPPNLTHLTLPYDFNQPVDHLPSTLTHLSLSGKFNQPIDNLPPCLLALNIGWVNSPFNHPVDHLPPSHHPCDPVTSFDLQSTPPPPFTL
jgi:hypothetical protein